MRILDDDPIATAPGSDTHGVAHGYSISRLRRDDSPEEEKFLLRLVEFRPAVRLYGEGRATGPPKDQKIKTVTGEKKSHATVSGC